MSILPNVNIFGIDHFDLQSTSRPLVLQRAAWTQWLALRVQKTEDFLRSKSSFYVPGSFLPLILLSEQWLSLQNPSSLGQIPKASEQLMLKHYNLWSAHPAKVILQGQLIVTFAKLCVSQRNSSMQSPFCACLILFSQKCTTFFIHFTVFSLFLFLYVQ